MSTEELEEIGLTRNEAKIYLALIELGSASSSQIIQKTGFHRAIVYDLLEKLSARGLVGYVIQGRKKSFEATNPQRLLDILREKEERINSILPRLLELSRFRSKLDVKIYKGREGIKTVYEDILRTAPKEWLSMGSGGETYQVLPFFLEQFHKKRIKAKINAKGLLLNTVKSKKRGLQIEKLELTTIKYLPKDLKTPTVINIYNDKVTLYSVTAEQIPFVILIENKELSKSFREYFEWLWEI